MKVAIVCSWLNQYGGAERVLEILHEMYPVAPIYTSIYAPERMPGAYRQWDIRTSFMQRLPFVKTHHQPFLPLYPLAFEQFDLSDYDVVISNSSAFCHGVITRPHTCHVCYCLTPARFLWHFAEYKRGENIGALGTLLLPLFLSYLRTWDALAANRVDHFVAISRTVAGRIAKYYRREATIIHPPVNTEAYRPATTIEDYFLIVSRLIPYKRVDLAIEAFNRLGLPLKISGDGRDYRSLRGIAKANIEFLGKVPDEEVRGLYARCQALIFPGEEDFGLTPLEAQAAGRPVIAYGAGGALETIVEGETGTFFWKQTPEELMQAVQHFDASRYDPARIRRHAERFGLQAFKENLSRFINEKHAEHRRLAEIFP
ncbi:MAG: glycosyltransferase [Chloroflexi bacterium]|nr:glycosyltransferase [Chloroflexota bacterium]